MKHGQFINGPEVQQFEEKLSEYLNVKHVITCANGTDALQLVYMATEVKRVEMPSFNYVASAEALRLIGGEIDFVDVDPYLYVINNKTPKFNHPDAVVVVGLFGYKPDSCIHAITWVIEDNAQCLGATVDGKHLTGDVGITSFFPTKNLACMGDGGAIYTDDDELAEKIRALKNHGQRFEKYHYDYIGLNSRLDTIQAAILIENLKELDNKIEQQRERGLKLCHKYGIPFNEEHTYNNFTIRVKDRAKFKEPHRVYYPVPLHYQKPYYQDVYLPVTEQLCKEVVTLL
jgi:UDP-2-acetamido-2-deoxy-ribo-hexuluronate aminotransferase